jgi:hypothetical protein
VGKTQRALTSLVAAIPAGVLTYLLVMVFLSRADTLKTMTMIVAFLTLACAMLVTLMPIGLLVLGGRKTKSDDKPAAGAAGDESGEAALVEDADVEASDAEISSGDISDSVEVSDSDLEESDEFVMDDSDADIMSDSSGEFSTGPASSLDEIDSVDFEDEEEEEPKPKKRKK